MDISTLKLFNKNVNKIIKFKNLFYLINKNITMIIINFTSKYLHNFIN